MIILTETTDKIQIVLAQSVASSQLQCIASYRDSNASDFIPGRSVMASNNTTPVDLVASPSSGYTRGIDYISVFNKDTNPSLLIVSIVLNSTSYTLWKGYISPGESLEYTNGMGFLLKNSIGSIKVDYVDASSVDSDAFSTPTIGTSKVVVLQNDFVMDNDTLLQDIKGLQFPVFADKQYFFEAAIRYETSASTVGTVHSFGGPPISYLMFDSSYSLAATTVTTNPSMVAFGLGTTNTNTANTPNARAQFRGFVRPAADGYIYVKVSSETNLASSLIVKAGSFLRWKQVYQF